MKALVSPFELGAVRPFPKGCLLGGLHHIFVYPIAWRRYRSSLIDQCAARGPVTESHWPSPQHFAVAERLRPIFAGSCWAVPELTFHPADPMAVVGEFEIGDLSEVEHIMDVEDEFELPKLGPELELLLSRDGVTLGDLVEFLLKTAPSNPSGAA